MSAARNNIATINENDNGDDKNLTTTTNGNTPKHHNITITVADSINDNDDNIKTSTHHYERRHKLTEIDQHHDNNNKPKTRAVATATDLAGTSTPQVHARAKPDGQDVERRPVHQVKVEVILKLRCIQNLMPTYGRWVPWVMFLVGLGWVRGTRGS